MQAEARRALTSLLLFFGLTACSLMPVWSNDYFWHLATGRWIVEHRALPESDPLAVASSKERWVTPWLFQSALYATYRIAGHDGIAMVRAICIAALFALLYAHLARELSEFLAFAVVFFAWYGALPWLRERPASAGAFLLVALLFLLRNIRSTRALAATLFALSVLWMNLHPSAIIAPVVVGVWVVGEVVESSSRRVIESADAPAAVLPSTTRRLDDSIALLAASAAGLFLNPYGLAGVLNPFEIARAAFLPAFDNEEWQPTSFRLFPLFLFALVATAAALIKSARKPGWVPATLLLLMLTALALRSSRNQTLFWVSLPLLLLPHLRPVPPRVRKLFAIPLAITVVAIVANCRFAIGIDREKFPVDATARVRSLNLRGNILADYGLGGFLIWSFLPERRVLTDGRNELYVDYQTRLQEARRTTGTWRQFVREHQVGLAYVLRRARPLWAENRATGQRVRRAEWDVYYPPREWALVAIDRTAAVFARRDVNRTAGIEIPRGALARWDELFP